MDWGDKKGLEKEMRGACVLVKSIAMNYLKIAEIANKCEVESQKILEHYRMVGANSHFSNEMRDAIYLAISNMEREKTRLEKMLRILITQHK